MTPFRLPLLALICALAAPVAARACSQPGNAAALAADITQRVNAERRQAGLGALSPSGALQKAAQSLACDNAAQGQWSHTGRNGSDLPARLRQAGYRYRAANENVGRFRSPSGAVSWWMGSSGHRANILSQNSRDIGVGVALDAGGRAYWVMVGGAQR
ncbi:CAP domain-containing protein [Szabonella alba]|uniref:CAP domain-containing protein n=1 Tax=Szabonella alba TaxID=2804194 RepID=A0A8K0VDU0_9RHOB|nr:CAP domain-containing protein [Szabonella alba]MBL4917864.1 CAP domain-containing protein [Szabonella alba]